MRGRDDNMNKESVSKRRRTVARTEKVGNEEFEEIAGCGREEVGERMLSATRRNL